MMPTKIFKNHRTIFLRQLLSIFNRQLLSILGKLLFGLEECARRIGNPKQNERFIDDNIDNFRPNQLPGAVREDFIGERLEDGTECL